MEIGESVRPGRLFLCPFPSCFGCVTCRKKETMAATEQTRIEVLLDGRQASDQLKDLSKNAAALRIELAKAYQANDAGKVAETEWELSKLDTRMKQLRKETVDVQAVLNNLSGATMSDLRQSIASVDARLNSKSIKRNSEEWNKLTEVKRTLIAEQKKLRQEMGATDGAIRKQRLSVADWVVSIGVVGKAYNYVTGFLRESLYSFNAFEKGVKGLSSLTGLTGTDLNYLSDQAKELSTSTLEGGIIIQQSATEIVDAYKMIGSQRPELLKNKEALNQVTQEAIILSEAAEMELSPASKALTNSLNQFNASSDQARRYINVLAAGSQAGAGDINYLSQAIEKSGTTANLMGLEFEQLVALIETAAPKFSEAAVAGNSVDKVLMEMKAKQIGYRDGVFDVNVALDELAGRFAKGELAADIFGKEHAKMVEVLVDGREEFSRYQEAVTGTNKAIEQAITNTDTNDARLQQQKNRLEQLRIELGEKLTPLIGAFTSGTASLVKILISAIGFFSKYGTAIAWVTAAITAQTVVMKYKLSLHSISEKLINRAISLNLAEAGSVKTLTAAKLLLTNGIKSATLATKVFFKSLMAHPLGLILTAVTALGVGVYKLVTHMSAVDKAIKQVNDTNKEFEKSTALEQITLNRLFGTLKGAKEGTKDWNDARKAITDKYGQYLSDLGIEITKLSDVETAYKSLSDAIKETMRAKAKNQAYDDAAKSLVDIQNEELKKIREEIYNTWDNDQKKAAEYFQYLKSELDKEGNMSKRASSIMLNAGIEKEVMKYKEAVQAYKAAQKEIEEVFGKNEKKAVKQGVPDLKTSTTGITPLTDEQKAALEAAQKARQKQLADEEAYRKQILVQAKTALEQEDSLNEERLRNAGLWGVETKDLQEKELQAKARGDEKEAALLRDKLDVLEALQKTHQAKILQITSNAEKQKQQQLTQAINKELQTKKAGYERELTELRIAHNEALADESLTAEERKNLKEKHQQEEREMTIRHTQDLITTMQDILGRTKIDGIDLAGNIFTTEEKEKLEAEILKARELISKLNADAAGKEDKKTDTDQPASLPVAEVDVLGMTPDMWETFFTNLEQGKFGIEEMQAAANALMNVWGTVNDFMAAKEKKQLKQYEKNTKAKKAALDKQLDAGKISQEQYNARVSQLDAELDAKKAEIENKQAKRQKAMSITEAIINTAVGITCALKTEPVWLGIALAAVVGAMGAAQIATIAAQPLPGAESGGYIDVVRSQDGRHFKAKDDRGRRGYVDQPTVITGESGREFVVNDEAVSNPTVKPILDVIDAAQQSGTIARLDLTQYMPRSLPGRASGGSIETAAEPTTLAAISSSDPEIKSLLRKNIEMMESLKNMDIVIPMYGRGGLMKALKKAQNYEQNTTF